MERLSLKKEEQLDEYLREGKLKPALKLVESKQKKGDKSDSLLVNFREIQPSEGQNTKYPRSTKSSFCFLLRTTAEFSKGKRNLKALLRGNHKSLTTRL